MPRYKYPNEALAAAAAQSRSIAEVLRRLGIRWSGGAHAHISRRLKSSGIDTTHFTGRPASPAGRPGPRLSPEQILVERAAHRRRARPELLRRAMVEAGVAYRCALCGTADSWNGKRLVLQVDHVNGDPADCRLRNVRFLCPNCHSQTETYAGRNRRVFAPASAAAASATPTEEEVVEIIERVDRGALSVVAAAGLVGCSRSHFYRIRLRLQETGSVAPRHAARRQRMSDRQQAIIAQALAHPDVGPKAIARLLRDPSAGGWRVSHDTVSTILRTVGLNSRAARRIAVATGAASTAAASL